MKRVILPILALAVCLIINSGVTAQNSGNSDFKPSGNLWGYVFGDYYVKQHGDSAARGGKNVQYGPGIQNNAVGSNSPTNTGANAFQIRRAYIGYDYNLTEKLSVYAVLANEQNQDAVGNNTTYLKYMYMKYANIFGKSNLFFGQMPTPSFAMTPTGTEPLWGYRSIERTLLDMHNIDGSTDMGVALQGNLWTGSVSNDTLLPALVGYEIMVGNGQSAKPETNIFKKFRGTIYAALLQQKLNFGIYADYFRTSLSPIKQENKTIKAYVDYRTRVFKIGVEAFMQQNMNSDEYQETGPEPTNLKSNVYVSGIQEGISLFCSGKILKKLNFFARYDYYNPDTKFNNSYYKTYEATEYGTGIASLKTLETNTSTYNQAFITGGLDYTLTKRVHIMPNIWYNKYESKLNIASDKLKSDYDLVPRVTFYVIFNQAKKVQNNGMDM